METEITTGGEATGVETTDTNDISYGDQYIDQAVHEAPEEEVEELAEDKKPKAKEETEEGDDKKADPAHKKPEPKAKKPVKEDSDDALTLTVDGKTIKARDINHLKQIAQKGLGAEKRFQEAHALRQKAIQLHELAKTNPVQFFKLTGQDPYQFAYNLLHEKIQYEEMDETQRKIHDYERRIKQAEMERQRWQQQEVARRKAEARARAAEEFDNKILETFKKSGLPKHKFYVQQIAATLLGAAQRGEELSVEEATDKIKTRTLQHLKEVVAHMDAKAIRAFLGEENLKKLLDAEVKRVTDKTAPTVKSAGRPGPTPVPQSKPKGPLSPREWDAYIEKMKRGA